MHHSPRVSCLVPLNFLAAQRIRPTGSAHIDKNDIATFAVHGAIGCIEGCCLDDGKTRAAIELELRLAPVAFGGCTEYGNIQRQRSLIRSSVIFGYAHVAADHREPGPLRSAGFDLESRGPAGYWRTRDNKRAYGGHHDESRRGEHVVVLPV